MHRRLMRRLAATSRDKRSFLSPVIIGLGIWIGFPTVAAYQDMASLVSGIEGAERALERLRREVGRGLGARRRDAVRRRRHDDGLDLGFGHRRARHRQGFAARQDAPIPIPDEDRIVRSDKKGRIVHVAPVAPPKTFDAGSIFKRTSLLVSPRTDEVKMAFAMPDIRGKEVEIATAFYMKQDKKRDPGVPAILAEPRQQREGRHPRHRLRAGRARLCQGLALREPDEGPERHRPLHPAASRTATMPG